MLKFSIIFCFSFRKQVAASKLEAEKDDVIVPTTLEEYCIKHKHKPDLDMDLADYYVDEDYDDDDDDDNYDVDDEEYCDEEKDDDDSGNGES